MFRDKSILRIFAVFILVNVNFVVDSQDLGPSSTTTNQAWNQTYVDILKKDLLAKYDKYARPSHHLNKTNIEMKLTLKHVDISEEKSIISVYGWMYMKWTDERLKWNLTEYPNLSYIYLEDNDVWVPEIRIVNSIQTSGKLNFWDDYNIHIEYNGRVTFAPTSFLRSPCILTMKKWPFDEQNCEVILGPDSSSEEMTVFMDSMGPGVETFYMFPGGEWHIKKTWTGKNEADKTGRSVRFGFTLVRSSKMYSVVTITPASVVILISLAAFWLPPTSGEKIILNGIVALIVCIFLTYFSKAMPVKSAETPYVVLFFSNCLYLTSISMIISVCVLCFGKRNHSYPVPTFLKTILALQDDSISGVTEFIQKYRSNTNKLSEEDDVKSDFAEDENEAQQMIKQESTVDDDWLKLALALDRFAFIIYSIIFIIFAICYSV